jgi:flagellar biosynthesis regulator FlbT
MIGSSCNENNCPGWIAALIVGMIGYFIVTIMFINEAMADVRVEITRELPEEKQLVVQQFDDEEMFQMWMATKMEDSCDPYVSEIKIIRNYQPNQDVKELL